MEQVHMVLLKHLVTNRDIVQYHTAAVHGVPLRIKHLGEPTAFSSIMSRSFIFWSITRILAVVATNIKCLVVLGVVLNASRYMYMVLFLINNIYCLYAVIQSISPGIFLTDFIYVLWNLVIQILDVFRVWNIPRISILTHEAFAPVFNLGDIFSFNLNELSWKHIRG